MTTHARVIAGWLLGIGLCAVVLAEVWWWRGGIIRLPLPIAAGEGLPVPLVCWMSLVLYAWGYSALVRIPLREQWGRAIRLGFGVHLVTLLGRSIWYVAHEAQGPLLIWYLRYWQAVWGVVLAIGIAGMGQWLVRWRSLRTADPQLFWVPLCGAYVGLWWSSWALAPLFTIGATVTGVGVLLGSRVAALRSAGRWLLEPWGRERWFLVAVGLMALALRLFYTSRVMSNPDFLSTGSDGPTYDLLAWSLAQGTPLPPDAVPWWSHQFFAPGYVRFLALVYWVVGRNYFVVCAIQSVLGALACVLLYDVAKRLFSVPVARIAAIFSALNFPMVFAAAAIGHQAMDLFWTLLVVWCLVRYLQDPARWGSRMWAVGLLLGWAAVTREGGTIVFWFFLLGWLLFGVRAALGWRAALQHALALSIGFLAVLWPFLRGSGEGLQRRMAHQWFYHRYTAVDINAWFNPWRDPAGALALLRDQPVTVLVTLAKGVIGNFAAVFLNQDYGSFDPVFLVRHSPYYVGMWWYAYALAFGGLGLVVWKAMRAPRQRLGWWLLLILLGARALPHLFLEAAYRHRVPLEPYLIMLAAYGLVRIMRAPASASAS